MEPTNSTNPEPELPPSSSPTPSLPVVAAEDLPTLAGRVVIDPAATPPTPRPGIRIARLLVVLLFLVGMCAFLPATVERLWYSINRARLMAEYDVAGELLAGDQGDDQLAETDRQLRLVSQRIGPLVSQRVGPSVVHISTTENTSENADELPPRRFQGSNPFPSRGQGSGVVVDRAGYILTNRHVVVGTRDIRIKLSDGRSLKATVAGYDFLTDLALLHVDAQDLIPIEWGNSDKLKVGSFVWAAGSPFGLESSITFGILSAKHRSAKVGQHHQDFLQTDAAVNPGNSGGPLVNSLGQLVGINTAIVGETYQGVSFAVPSNVAHDIYEQLRATGTVQRGWLGLALDDVSEPLAEQLGLDMPHGALVAEYAPGPSPARNAGVEIGDLIIKYNDEPIEGRGELIREVGQSRPGDVITLEILRDGDPQTIKFTLGERPANSQ